jgi:hypothetical protein
MALINPPPNTPVDVLVTNESMEMVDGKLKKKISYTLKISQAWLNVFNQVFRISSAVTQR